MILKTGHSGGHTFEYFTKKIVVSLYADWTITVCFSTDIQAARQQQDIVRTFGSIEPRSNAGFCETHPNVLRTLVMLPLHPVDYRLPHEATIAHESYHAARAILEKVGVGDNEEGTAYLLEHIVLKITHFGKDVYDFMQDVLEDVKKEKQKEKDAKTIGKK